MISYYKIIYTREDKELRLKLYSLHELIEALHKLYFDREVDKQSIEITTMI